MQIALATGGTAGHVTPALAVADAIGRRWPDAGVRFLGSASGFEAQLVAARGHAFTSLPAAPWYGVGTVGRVRAGERLVAGVRAARAALAARWHRRRDRLRRLRDGRRRAGGAQPAHSGRAARGQRTAGAEQSPARPHRVGDLRRLAGGGGGVLSHGAHPPDRHADPRRDRGAGRCGASAAGRAGRLRLLVCGGSLGSAISQSAACPTWRRRCASAASPSRCGTRPAPGRSTSCARPTTRRASRRASPRTSTTWRPRIAGRTSPSPAPAPPRWPRSRPPACRPFWSRSRRPPTITRPTTRRHSRAPPARPGCASATGTRRRSPER